MTSECLDDSACFNVPDLDRGVVGPRGKNVVVELQTSDAIIVSLERLDGATASLPVIANLEAIPVYVLPWPELALDLEL